MGYIDKINRQSNVIDDNGTVQTRFTINCTDFTKIFDRTDIYFNPHLKNRSDLVDPQFGKSQLAGLALQTAGLTAHGSPADLIENLSVLLLGFGAQWTLPKSYEQAARGFTKLNRERRRQRTKSKVPTNALQQAAELFGSTISNLEFAIQGTEDDVNQWLNLEAENRANPDDGDERIEAIYNDYKSKYSQLFSNTLALSAYQTVVRESSENSPYTFLDLLDLSFIEAMAIDGYILTASIWESAGSLASIMYNFSNQDINELFFDLRPVVEDSTQGFHDTCFGEQYSKQPDELGINREGFGNFPASVPAVKYVPAIVMREYPYSTVEGIDMRNYYTRDSKQLGFLPFGPIFSITKQSTEPHRVLYNYTTVDELVVNNNASLSPNKCAFADISSPLKHLDIVQITTQDVIEDSVGRHDHSVINFFSMYAESPLTEMQKYTFENIMPIATPVSIERHGLRTWEPTSKFADFTRDNICGNEAVQDVGEGSGQVERNLVRWALMLDHWNQHNVEYLDGSITVRGMPEIRVGYRLDWLDRNESYYVEGIQHKWSYGQEMATTISVSRGQRNDPFPVYIPPTVSKFKLEQRNVPTENFEKKQGGNRGNHGSNENSRLSEFFKIKPHLATIRSVGANSRDISDFTKTNIIDELSNPEHGGTAIYPNRKAPREVLEPAPIAAAIASADPENPELPVKPTKVKPVVSVKRHQNAPSASAIQLTANFNSEMFRCKDGEPVPANLLGNVSLLCDQLEKIKAAAGGKNITIISGFRTASYNATRKGAATNSFHIQGKACDFRIDGMSPGQVHKLVAQLIEDGVILEGGLGKYNRFTHYDIRGTKARWSRSSGKSKPTGNTSDL